MFNFLFGKKNPKQEEQIWYLNTGPRYREDMPAVEYADGRRLYSEDGKLTEWQRVPDHLAKHLHKHSQRAD